MPPSQTKASLRIERGVFLSDLHLFSPRSVGGNTHQVLSQFHHENQCIVLGGDIFDFRWSKQGSHLATLEAAQLWLENLFRQTGQAQIRFLPGNHDCHPEFLQRLTQLAETEPRFDWREFYLQLGNSLFLHGDILDAQGDLSRYRRRFWHTRPQPQVSHHAYDVVCGMRLHKLIPMLRHQPRSTCLRLWQYIQALDLPDLSQIHRVYFGHTHVPIRGLRVNDVRFYNPGAMLRHLDSHLVHFEFDEAVVLDTAEVDDP